MDSPEIMSGQSPEEENILTKAGFLNRFAARIIDFIIIAALYEAIPKVGYLAGLTYMLVADGIFQGRSIGKKLMGIRVIHFGADDIIEDSGFRESLLRNLPFAIGYIIMGLLGAVPLIGWLLSFMIAAVILVFESLIIVGSEKGMRLGDEIAKTQVVDDRKGGVDVQ